MSLARWSKAYCQPVDDLHHALVVGVELLVAAAELDELLEARAAARGLAALLRRTDRTRQRVELRRVALKLDRVADDQLDAPLGVRLDLADPAGVEGLAGRDRDLVVAQEQRQRTVRFRISDRHHVGDAADVDLQRIDALVRHAAALAEPLGQRFGVERAAGLRVRQPRVAQSHQRMLHAAARSESPLGELGVSRADHRVVEQPLQHLAPVEPAYTRTRHVRRGRRLVRGQRHRGGGFHASIVLRWGAGSGRIMRSHLRAGNAYRL